uniref:RING-type E3 ubiquitin transferase n=1 Tax=Myotis lucifugus TaxID=59463 RepID=G1QCD7_MYOLU
RTFARGAHHSGTSCHFAQDRKASQVCRYFQRGFCFHGDRCSYQHPQPPGHLQWGRRHSEPLVTQPGPPLGLTRRGSEPTYLPPSPSSIPSQRDPPPPPRHCSLCPRSRIPYHSIAVISPVYQKHVTYIYTYIKNKKSQPKSDPVQELWAQLQSMDLERNRDTRDFVCAISMDKVWDKPEGKRFFAILPTCTHAPSLASLPPGGKTPHPFPLNVIKACPQCRVYSSYIIPHKFWVSEGAEKEQLIRNFKARTSQIPCRYFARGSGRCPFKSDCIYLHQLP